MSPIAGILPVGRIVSHDELYGVANDPNPYGVLVVDESRDFDHPSTDAEYVRNLGFLFNGPDLLSLRRA